MRIFRRFLPLFFAPLLALLPLQQGRAAVDASLNITVAPPALPVYVQPPIPAEGYIWTPGYWAWGPYGYYWVPGTWVLPPRVGFLWTPGYWGWADGLYAWHAGYWGPHIGFYGGVNYGFGYIGVGFVGGFWDHDHFHYNQAVNNFGGTHITNIYNKTVINNISRVSYNGGHGGLSARPNAEEQAAAHDEHERPTDLQARHERMASNNTALRASMNHGRPSIAATPRPAAFTEHGTVGARGANGAPNGQHQAGTPGGGHPQGQNGGPQHQGNARVAAAGNGQRPPHQQGQPGGHPQGGPQGGPQHPVKAAAAHPGGGPQHGHPGPQQGGGPQNRGPAPQQGSGAHPDNHEQQH